MLDSERLDTRLFKEFKLPSRSSAQHLIREGHVLVNGEVISKPSSTVSLNDHIKLDSQYLKQKPEVLDLEIIYEDDDCLVVNKPVGVLSHSKGTFNHEGTVASWLAEHEGIEDMGTNREGIVHRLDRGTSGVMIVAKNNDSLKWLQKQFSTRKVKKTYVAVVEGKIEPETAIIDMPIERNPNKPQRFRVGANGKPAQTEYKTLKYVDMDGRVFSQLQLMPKTGRTHQLRVHLDYLKHPIVGDEFYGGIKSDRLYLHALSLELTLPSKDRMTFNAALPKQFNNPKVK